jgi:hypothetical protein
MSPNTQTEAAAGWPSGTANTDESLIDYMENAPQPLPPQDPIGPPDVQPAEAPVNIDE